MHNCECSKEEGLGSKIEGRGECGGGDCNCEG